METIEADKLSEFNKIRPYTDIEAVDAYKRIAEDPMLESIRAAVMKDLSLENLKTILKSFDNIFDFQSKLMAKVLEFILDKTTQKITYEGVENIKDATKHLITSNHRDIFLDPAIMQLIFFKNEVPPTEIAVGDNLITSTFIDDIARGNRMIKVIRSGSVREKYTASVMLSEYIRYKVANQFCSVWIAQRNGRTKNGIDVTEQGLLKMFEMSGSGDFVKDFTDLSIVPLAISYEFEPCDFLKTRELYISKREKYQKASGEDLNSIITGIKQKKGRVNYNFANPISEDDVRKCARFDKNERFQALAKLIDSRIYKSYKLWPNNYIAYDILNKSEKYVSEYTNNERESFIVYMEAGISKLLEADSHMDMSELRELFLSIYSGPVINKNL